MMNPTLSLPSPLMLCRIQTMDYKILNSQNFDIRPSAVSGSRV